MVDPLSELIGFIAINNGCSLGTLSLNRSALNPELLKLNPVDCQLWTQ